MKSDTLLVVSGLPLPGVVNMFAEAARHADHSGIYLIRKHKNEIKINLSRTGCNVFYIGNGVKGVSWQRFFATPFIYLELILAIVNRAYKIKAIPRAVYCTSPDVLLLFIILKPFLRWAVKYDVRDLNLLSFDNSVAGKTYRCIESSLIKRTDKIAVSSTAFYDQYFKKLIHHSRVYLLENVPNQGPWIQFARGNHKNPTLTVGMVGIIRYRKSIDALLDAVKKINKSSIRIKVLLAGGKGEDCSDVGSIKYPWLKQLPEFNYEKEIAYLYNQIDIIYAVYDSLNRNCQLAMPTKYYESIITKTPILVAKGTFVSIQVEKTGIGRAIDLENLSDLEETLVSACENNSWYGNAVGRLEKMSIENLRSELHKNVTGFIT